MAMTVEQLMQEALDKEASDIHLKEGNPPILRIDGELVRLEGQDALTEDDLQEMLKQIASPADIIKFQKVMELDNSFTRAGPASASTCVKTTATRASSCDSSPSSSRPWRS